MAIWIRKRKIARAATLRAITGRSINIPAIGVAVEDGLAEAATVGVGVATAGAAAEDSGDKLAEACRGIGLESTSGCRSWFAGANRIEVKERNPYEDEVSTLYRGNLFRKRIGNGATGFR
jgi:hypothetical protein